MAKELTEMVSTVLAPRERKALEREARELDLSRSAYIRRALRASLGMGALPEDTEQRKRSRWRETGGGDSEEGCATEA